MNMDCQQSRIEFTQDNISNMLFVTHEDETINFDLLLEEIEGIDDLDALENIQNTLLSERHSKTEALDNICSLNAEVKGEVNKTKWSVQELDTFQDDELQKIEHLMEMIQKKKQEVLQEEVQQVDDLDQFELEVIKITKEFTTAPKEYQSNSLKEKMYHLNTILEETKNVRQQEVEKVTDAQDQFNKPIKIEPMELPLTILVDGITDFTSSNTSLVELFNQLEKEAEKVRLDMMTNSFRRQSSFGKN